MGEGKKEIQIIYKKVTQINSDLLLIMDLLAKLNI